MKARFSWVVYLKFGVIAALSYLVVLTSVPRFMALTFGIPTHHQMVAVVLIVFTLIFFISVFYFLYKVHDCCAFTNKDGVWLHKNIFPWSRGLMGVRWENFDQAQYRASMTSWMTNSYTVYLRDRFGKTVVIKNLYDGRRWSSKVNAVVMKP